MGTTETDSGADLTAEVDVTARPTHTDLHDPTRRHEVEKALTTVPGVLGARLVPGYERPVDELHVLTSLAKTPKQAVRDLQTLLMARFGVATDHRVISVVQLDEEDAVRGAVTSRRPVITRVAISHAGLEVQTDVTLIDDDEEHVGHAVGPSTATGQREAVARATLDAVRDLLDDRTRVELDACDVADVRSHRVALTLLRFRGGRGEHAVAGSAVVRDAEADAIARSVLDALNRSLEDPSGS